jgi:hypothetical protein
MGVQPSADQSTSHTLRREPESVPRATPTLRFSRRPIREAVLAIERAESTMKLESSQVLCMIRLEQQEATRQPSPAAGTAQRKSSQAALEAE